MKNNLHPLKFGVASESVPRLSEFAICNLDYHNDVNVPLPL
jgi:hypothetical protein